MTGWLTELTTLLQMCTWTLSHEDAYLCLNYYERQKKTVEAVLFQKDIYDYLQNDQVCFWIVWYGWLAGWLTGWCLWCLLLISEALNKHWIIHWHGLVYWSNDRIGWYDRDTKHTLNTFIYKHCHLGSYFSCSYLMFEQIQFIL